MYFDSYTDFEEWAYANNYDPENKVDEEEESHKRDTLLSFYMENSVTKLWACVSVVCSYGDGWRDVEVTEGLTQKTVVTTKNVYE